jgi:hypothetical protein
MMIPVSNDPHYAGVPLALVKKGERLGLPYERVAFDDLDFPKRGPISTPHGTYYFRCKGGCKPGPEPDCPVCKCYRLAPEPPPPKLPEPIEEAVPADAVLTKHLPGPVVTRTLRSEFQALNPWVVCCVPASDEMRRLVPLDDRDLLWDRELNCACYVLGQAELYEVEERPLPGLLNRHDWSTGVRLRVVHDAFRPFGWYDPQSIARWTRDCARCQRETEAARNPQSLARRVEALEAEAQGR